MPPVVSSAAGKRPLSALLKGVALPTFATASITGLTISSIWSGVDDAQLTASISDASSTTLQYASELSSVDGDRIEHAKICAVEKVRTASIVVPTLAIGTGTFLGCVMAYKVTDSVGFVRRYRILRTAVPVLLGTAGTIGGAVVGMNLTVATVISVGNRAMLGVLLGEFGAPEWIVNFLIS
mmetsp:Transcript_15370/g.33422  ORF Transcript_15370/g.33422 Transcript_15370/m.33422 type:complete len:181 (-) Transcript_15370:212-754(-)|eukprot:CAMPEP_0178501566 /NCGR_PEP_ID=MMETSP0696-20121128/17024_1 /TAXON_ID=265572 /ORGANISM="Extubocellulus spinifer, Strain CCMP396" /LENGTH=180 /DNA_ID=CAMNT_0020130535 /DNA_START=45 /DNA_END=587 /DNA_ORIENTATION=+